MSKNILNLLNNFYSFFLQIKLAFISMTIMSVKVAKNTKIINTLVSAADVSFIKSVALHTFHVSVHAKPGARQSAIVPPVTRSL